MKRHSTAILAFIIALGIAGCGGNIVRREVEKSVAASLPETIGPADNYTVTAGGSTVKMLQGKVGSLDITGTNVKFAGGITVARLVVNIKDISFDIDNKQIKRVGSTQYSAAISQEELTRYMSRKYSDIRDLKVELRDGVVKLAARPGISRLTMGVQASAAIEVRKDRILALDLRTLKVAGINTPGFARELLDSQLDTIFDAKDLGFDARIKSAVITPGILTLTGDLDLTKATPKPTR